MGLPDASISSAVVLRVRQGSGGLVPGALSIRLTPGHMAKKCLTSLGVDARLAAFSDWIDDYTATAFGKRVQFPHGRATVIGDES
jgi:hypothetical protein